MVNNLAVIVHSKDCYKDTAHECVDGIFHYINPRYKVFVTSEDENFEDKRIENIKTGQGLWSTRLRFALNQLKTRGYNTVMFFLEDMVTKNADVSTMEQVIQFHFANDNDCTKMGRHHLHYVEDTGAMIGKHKILNQIHEPYILSHQPVALFKIDFFLKSLQEDVSPWEHEIRINRQFYDGKHGDYKVMIVGSNPADYWAEGKDFGEIIEYHHALAKGQKIPYYGKYR